MFHVTRQCGSLTQFVDRECPRARQSWERCAGGSFDSFIEAARRIRNQF